jgi:hypothetical protein
VSELRSTYSTVTTFSSSAVARAAGVLYLIIIVSGLFSELFVRARLIVDGDVGATAAHILASMSLFRSGFAADTVMLLSDVAIAVLLYVLLRPVNGTLSLLAAAFRLTQASILGLNLLFYYSASVVLNSTAQVGIFTDEQLQSLATLLLNMHSHGYDLGLIFFAASNFILGYLIARSKCTTTVLGYGLVAAAFVYLTGSSIRFLAPHLLPVFEPVYAIAFVAEVAFALWLLTRRDTVRIACAGR